MISYEGKLFESISLLYEDFDKIERYLYELSWDKKPREGIDSKLNDLILHARNLIKEIKDSLETCRQLNTILTLSKKLKEIGVESATIEYEAVIVKRKKRLDTTGIKKLLKDLYSLDVCIKEYNRLFGEKLPILKLENKAYKEIVETFFEAIAKASEKDVK